MKKILIVLGLLAVFATVTKICLSCSEKRIADLTEQVEALKEDCVPMRFEILKKKDSQITVKVAFYDIVTGNKVGKSDTFELNGEELNVDFQIIKLSPNNFIFFPSGLYTDMIPLAESKPLYKLYEKQGFPLIYEGIADTSSKAGKKNLKQELCQYLALSTTLVNTEKESGKKELYGTSIHDFKTISQFKKGFVYKVLCHPHTGGIEIVKED